MLFSPRCTYLTIRCSQPVSLFGLLRNDRSERPPTEVTCSKGKWTPESRQSPPCCFRAAPSCDPVCYVADTILAQRYWSMPCDACLKFIIPCICLKKGVCVSPKTQNTSTWSPSTVLIFQQPGRGEARFSVLARLLNHGPHSAAYLILQSSLTPVR